MSLHAATHSRHAELVSASIRQHERTSEARHGGTASLSPAIFAHAAEWTLKQVQGDAVFNAIGAGVTRNA